MFHHLLCGKKIVVAYSLENLTECWKTYTGTKHYERDITLN